MKTMTYADLLERLCDVRHLAELPAPNERSGSFSSTSRDSRYDAATDQYLDWNSNADADGHIRKEGDYIVAVETEGPGVLWRVWSALPQSGRIEIFIDDETTPVIDMPFEDFFDRFGSDVPKFGDQTPPMNFPDLAPTLSRGRNRFIPIPYNRYCKVRLGPGWGCYYHFTYTTFAEGTVLPAFSEAIDQAAYIALAETDRSLSRRGWSVPESPEGVIERYQVEVPPGETVRVASIEGNRAITRLHASLDLPPKPRDADVLRELALSISWDGESSPSVWSPLGDFFGSAPGLNHYRSLPLGMTDAGMYSHWYMPFANGALIELTNDGTESRTVTFSVHHEPLRRPAGELLRFHAKWHRDAFLERSQQKGRELDWPFLFVEGRGRFCGIHLHVWNRWNEPEKRAETWWYGAWYDKTIGWWWGEGDEKFFVDGEKYPSTFGTGSEDYIGYAWAAEPPFPTFDSAFASQPFVELNANGHTSVNRFHIADNIPFTTSFEGCLEKYKPNVWGDGNPCLFAAVAYWYQEAGQTDPYPVVPVDERVGYWVDP